MFDLRASCRRVGELRDHDRGKDAQDDHDDQDLDQGEPAVGSAGHGTAYVARAGLP